MAFRTSWMVKGRFSSCLNWAWLKTRGRRSILAWVSGSSVSWGGGVLPEEAVLGGLEHCGWVVGEGAVLLPDRGDGAVAVVGHGVVKVADGLVGEFMLRIPFVFLGDALLPVDVPPLQVCPDVGYPCPAVVYLAAGSAGVSVEEGRQLLLRMPEVIQHVPQGRGWLVVVCVGVLLEAAGDGRRAHGCE